MYRVGGDAATAAAGGGAAAVETSLDASGRGVGSAGSSFDDAVLSAHARAHRGAYYNAQPHDMTYHDAHAATAAARDAAAFEGGGGGGGAFGDFAGFASTLGRYGFFGDDDDDEFDGDSSINSLYADGEAAPLRGRGV
jgi:hypothetical protein